MPSRFSSWSKFQSAMAGYFLLYALALVWRYWTSHNWHAGLDASVATFVLTWIIHEKRKYGKSYREIFSDVIVIAALMFTALIITAAFRW